MLLSLTLAGHVWWRTRRGRAGYQTLRETFGGVLLLGLEVLVAADLIRTVAVEPTVMNVAILGMIVLIRTFLSFSLEIEIEGVPPWRRRSRWRRTLPVRGGIKCRRCCSAEVITPTASTPCSRARHHCQASVTMIAPASEPMIPLGRKARPSPEIRLMMSPPMKEPTMPADKCASPVDTLCRPADDELRGGPDEHPEQDDAEKEHAASLCCLPGNAIRPQACALTHDDPVTDRRADTTSITPEG